MSEFSVSFHLKTDNINDCIEMLKSCKAKGYIFPVSNNWVSFVSDADYIEQDDRVIKVNKGTLLYYNFAEDFGWGFSFFKNDKVVCSYTCLWSGEYYNENDELVEVEGIYIDDSELFLDKIMDLVGNDINKLNDIKKLLYPENIESVFLNCPVNKFAELLGIENYNWVSYEYLERHPNKHLGVIKVE